MIVWGEVVCLCLCVCANALTHTSARTLAKAWMSDP